MDADGLIELVAYEGAAIWLFRRLRALTLLDRIPASVAERLRQLAFDATARRLEVEAEAATVVALLERADIPVILIKGVARCALAPRVPYFDARGTLDVDLLVPQAGSAAAQAALLRAGYLPALSPAESLTGHHHLPPLQRGSVTVELHESSSIRVPAAVAWDRAHGQSELMRWAGLMVRVPSVTELAWSAIAHAMEDDVAGFRCNRYLEVAALLGSGAPIDWATIATRAAGNEAFPANAGVIDGTKIIRRWLGAAGRLAPIEPLPDAIADRSFALDMLLAWRLRVLRAATTLGRPASERLLAEGARALIGLPLEPSPPEASGWGKIRRSVAGQASRLAFHGWRAAT